MSQTCLVTFTARGPDGSVLPNAKLVFELATRRIQAVGAWTVPPDLRAVVADAAGQGSISLVGGVYTVSMISSLGTLKAPITVPATGTVDLWALLEQSGGELAPASVLLAQEAATLANYWAGVADGYKNTANVHRLAADAAADRAQDTAAALTGFDLEAIAASKAVTAVDVFVYDTSLDSDGGAWRKQCQHTSWYQEALGTATRGMRREFPAVAVIVAEGAKVTIYDGDDSALPMWMVFTTLAAHTTYIGFEVGINRPVSAVAAVNGVMAVARTANGAAGVTHFVQDMGEYFSLNLCGRMSGGVVSRNEAQVITDDGRRAVSNVNYDVAMTVLPGAPINPRTGMPAVTIAFGGDNGVTLIRDDGSIFKDTSIASASGKAVRVGFTEDHTLYRMWGNDSRRVGFLKAGIPAADNASDSAWWIFGDPPTWVGFPYFKGINGTIQHGPGSQAYYGSTTALNFLHRDPQARDKSMVATVGAAYSSGWMPGDTKGAWLADTVAGSLVGGTVADRSVRNNGLTVQGTLTRSAVDIGSELVGYSGFSAANYLEQVGNTDLNFGTGDFCVMGWIKASAAGPIFAEWNDLSDASGVGWLLAIMGSANNSIGFFRRNAGVNIPMINIGRTVTDGNWHQFVFFRRAGVLYVCQDGLVISSVSMGSSVSSGAGTLRLGASLSASSFSSGSLALIRMAATAPTADQIAKIYADERALFQPGAQCTLYGTSDGVGSLAFDPKTGLLHVGTSQGRSDFQGLRRVKNTTNAVGVAISAVNGLIVEE